MDGNVMKEFMLRVTPQELQVVVGAMHDQPYKVVAQLLNKLQAQITEQEMAAQPAEPSKRVRKPRSLRMGSGGQASG